MRVASDATATSPQRGEVLCLASRFAQLYCNRAHLSPLGRGRRGFARRVRGLSSPLLLAQHEIDDPTPADMRASASAVAEDVFVVAPGILNRVCENGHRAEVTRLIHLTSQRER